MHRPLLVGGEVARRRERLRVRVRPGDVVQREIPVEVGGPAQRRQLGRRPGCEARAPQCALVRSFALRIAHRFSLSTLHSQSCDAVDRPLERTSADQQRPGGAADHDRRARSARTARGRGIRARSPVVAEDRPGRDRPDHELRGVCGQRHRPDRPQRKHDPGERRCGTASRHAPITPSAKPPEPITSRRPLECGAAVQTAPTVRDGLGRLVRAGRGIQPVADEGEQRRRRPAATAARACAGCRRGRRRGRRG